MKALCDYLKYVHLSGEFQRYLNHSAYDRLIVPFEPLFPGLTAKKQQEELFCKNYCKKQNISLLGAEVLYYHHGLKLLPQSVHRYIQGKFFLDLGAYNGDSAYVFSLYEPKTIWAFEPSPANIAECRKNLESWNIRNVEIIQAGVADVPGKLYFSEALSQTALSSQGDIEVDITTIDDFCHSRPAENIGIIKADLEGMGLKMLKGALQTVKANRPVLLLSIYHNQDEFLKIYPLLKETVPDYRYQVAALNGYSELTLIAAPQESF